MDIVWVPEFALAGWVKPLDDLFASEEQQAFLPAPSRPADTTGMSRSPKPDR